MLGSGLNLRNIISPTKKIVRKKFIRIDDMREIFGDLDPNMTETGFNHAISELDDLGRNTVTFSNSIQWFRGTEEHHA